MKITITQDYFTKVSVISRHFSCIMRQSADVVTIQYEHIPKLCEALTKLHSEWLQTQQDS